jgi:hypothetical protein
LNPLILFLLMAPAQASAQPALQCYRAATQIGTAARRDFRDDNGVMVKEIYY